MAFSDKSDEIIRDIVKDDTFLKNIMQMDMQEAQKAFAERGISFSEQDMLAIRDLVQAKINGQNALSDQILNEVSGGKGITKRIKNIAIAISALAIGSSIAALSYKGYNTLNALDNTMDKVEKKTTKSLKKITKSTKKAINKTSGTIESYTAQKSGWLSCLFGWGGKG